MAIYCMDEILLIMKFQLLHHSYKLALNTYIARIKHHVCLVQDLGVPSSLIEPHYPDYHKLAMA